MIKEDISGAALGDLLQLQSLASLRDAIGPYLIKNRKGTIKHEGRHWSHDDYLSISVEWYQLAVNVGLNVDQTRKWLDLETADLERLGIAL